MASTQTNGLKRPHPQDDDEGAQKRPRSNNGSPAPQTNGSRPDVSKIIAEARAKAAALAAKKGSQHGASPSPGPPSSSTMSDSVQAKIAAMKARVAAATAKASSAAPQRPTPQPITNYQPPSYDEPISRARGGLDVGLHPALMGDSSQDARSGKGRQAMQPKFATTMANKRTESPLSQATKGKKQLDLSGPSIEEVKNNPYFDPGLSHKTVSAKGRLAKQLVFNQKGKYIAQANALRRQAALEAMKKRIAESSRKAGIDEDLDTEKAFLVQAPPEIEWWDEGIVNGKNYSDISPANLKIDTPDSIVTAYIQHPVALEPPQEKNAPPPKPMFLTPQEQKKLRRQRRMADLKEEQAKIRLGLKPAPPPKVKKSNLMRVLGEEAVKDPTAVEARVNREIQERFDTHMATNEERKLTKDQRNEKLERQQEADASKGIYATVYKIDTLANGRHRFKISKNAEQQALTGVCIMHPKFCLVVVEGGSHSISYYKKLMMSRIDWTENSAPNSAREGNKEALAAWIEAEDEKGNLKDLGLNKCQLVWEGEQKRRAFRKWGSKVCETDKEARDTLSRAKMDSFWTVAKNLDGAK
ncbi:MAG: hypothetical protein MMC23_001188 [Stictis urceolatum]|nr:hypothetical protein [Stictis urceolata]